ncbi:metallophosphoesterase superfamily enzyme [Methanohalophilus levihalophilus]|uniref:metallophosphoesterase n=1 Tax=Methanohalophilus levihalophilus TaxID=1431282 RepID=UPI001AE185ED|nr:metallophosphoesterase [Methanohalophilus levihalophilus]MBP2029659.1 metallophosphoesterase superfamily enzyme [Methanohalophilus levihalophilus]
MPVKTYPIPDEPALIVEGESKALVIADIHIGIEWDLYSSGFLVPSRLEERMKRIEEYIQQTQPDRIILLGDIKHNVPQISWQERDEIPYFLGKLAGHAPVDLFPGNHDGNMELLLPDEGDVTLHPSRGDVIEDVGYFHGHTWPSPVVASAPLIITAHNHPTVRLTDSLGYAATEQAWLRTHLLTDVIAEHYSKVGISMENSPTKPEVIVVPAFNEICGGVPFNEAGMDELLGPAFSSGAIDVDNAQVYLLDGMQLGKVKDIRKLDVTKKRPPRKRRNKGKKNGGKKCD